MVRSLSRRTFVAAATLSAVAGFVDGFGFVFLGGYFVSFMSGNTTRASVDLAGASLAAAGHAFLLIAAFVLGAMTATATPAGRRRGEVRVLVGVAVVLVIAAATTMTPWMWLTGAILAFAMGGMNIVFARGGEVSFGITYMTGALVKLAQAVVAALRGGPPLVWVRHLVLWASIAGGAVLGAAGFAVAGASALWIAPLAILIGLAVPAARSSLGG